MLRSKCPQCDAPLAATREVLYSGVTLNEECEPIRGREIGEGWHLYCERGHLLEVDESRTGRRIAVLSNTRG